MSRLLAFGVAALLVTLALYRGSVATSRLRGEIAGQRDTRDRLDHARAERHRLEAARVAPAEMERLRLDLEAVKLLTAQLDAGKSHAEGSSSAPVTAGSVAGSSVRREGSGTIKKVSEMTNAGRQTIGSALETFFWSATSRDLANLKQMIRIQRSEREGGDRLSAVAAETSDRIAELIVNDTGRYLAMWIVGVAPTDELAPRTAQVSISLQQADEIGVDPKDWKAGAFLTMIDEPDGWTVVIPASNLAVYHFQAKVGQ